MKSSRLLDCQSRFKLLFLFAFIFIIALSAFAGPSTTTYQAKIIKPDGQPLEAASVNFRFSILDPSGICILYAENHAAVNMSSSAGLVSFALGSGVKAYPVSSTTFEQVFSNITPSLSCDAGGPVSYSPLANDTRKIVMQFHDGSGWQTLPAMSINAVPYAMYANDSQSLGGVSASAYVRSSLIPACGVSEAVRYNGSSFLCIAVGGAGGSVTSGSVVTALGYTPADGASVTTLTSSLASTDTVVSSVSSTVFAVSSTVAGLSGSVTGLSTSVSNLSASMAAIVSSQWVTSGTSISYSAGRVAVSGGVQIGVEAATCTSTLAGTLRYNSGVVEYCDGTSWAAFGVSGAGILAINGLVSGSQTFAFGTSGTTPNVSSVGSVHTFSFPYASAAATTAGVISNSDYSLFSTVVSKITSSAASIAEVLGYTPASVTSVNAVSATVSGLSAMTSTLSSTVDAVSTTANSKITSSAAAVAQVLGYVPVSTSKGLFADGAFNNPSISFASTPGTGFYNSGGNLGISIGGGLKGTWSSSSLGFNAGVAGPQINFTGGNEAQPSFAFNVDSDTGMFNPNSSGGSNELGFSTSGTEKLRISSTGNVGIGTSNPMALLNVHGTSQTTERIRLSGQEFYQAGNTDTDGISLLVGVNRPGNRQLWIGDSASLTPNSSNTLVRINPNSGDISVLGTDGVTAKKLTLNAVGGLVGIGGSAATARLQIAASTSSTAPLKLTSGTLTDSAQAGAIEYDGFNYYVTDGTNTRRAIAMSSQAGTYDNVNGISSTGNLTITPTGSVIVSSTTGSVNSQTGALIVKGGVGIAGDINASGTLNVTGAANFGSNLFANGNIHTGGGNRGFWMDTPGSYNYGLWRDPSNNVHLRSGGTTNHLTIVSSTGFVGVGTAVPTAKLDVAGVLSSGVSDYSINAPTFQLTNQSRVDGISGISPTGAFRWYTNPNSADRTGFLYVLRSYDTTNGESGGLMTIKGNGNVGIGTTSPAHKLSVTGDIAKQTTTGIDGTFDNFLKYGHVTDLESGTSAANRWHGIDASITAGGASNNKMKFRMYAGTAANSAPVDVMTIQGDGNVGIGTTAPTEKLDVNGAIRALSYVFNAPTGDPVPTITARTVPAGQGAANEKTELILFHSNDYNNGAGNDQITLRAPALSFQTYADPSVADINSNAGYNERMYIAGTGAVGIGTTNPLRILHVAASGSTEIMSEDTNTASATIGRIWRTRSHGGTYYFDAMNNDLTGGLNVMTMEGTGNVGIGTAPLPSIGAALHVYRATDARAVVDSGTGSSGLELRTGSVSSAGGGYIDFASGSTNSNSPDYEFRIIRGPAGLSFQTPGSNSRMLVDVSGRVGIGTDTPSNALTVSNTSIFSPTTNVSSAIMIGGPNSPGHAFGGGILMRDHVYYGGMWMTGLGTVLSFGAGGMASGFPNVNTLAVTASGAVGVGTQAPTEKFEVVGNIKVSGEIYKTTSWGFKKGPAAFISDYINSWTSGYHAGTSIDCTSSANGCSILKSGTYEIRCVQRANSTTSTFVGVALNGDRATLEAYANGVWSHDHSITGGGFTESNYMGTLTAGQFISCGPPTANSTFVTYGPSGYNGTITIKRID